MPKEAKKQKNELKDRKKYESPIEYHEGFGCWSLNGSLGVSFSSMRKKAALEFEVSEGQTVKKGDVIARAGDVRVMAPFDCKIVEINRELSSRPVGGADWAFRTEPA